MPHNSEYSDRLSKENTYENKTFWILRLDMNKDQDCIITSDLHKESIMFYHERPYYIVEYKKNQLFVTGHPTPGYYLISDWNNVRYFRDQNPSNTNLWFAFQLPNFE